MYGSDARIREGVRQALESGQTEVTMWGDTGRPIWTAQCGSVEHRLSMAARAFKAQALAPSGIAGDLRRRAIGFTETFRSGTPACCPVAADLVPAS